MTITARDTTTPDSAVLRISVTGAADLPAAKVAAYELLAASRYTRNASIYEHTRTASGDFNFYADYK